MARIAVAAAIPKLARWGGLRRDVRLRILPSHGALEREAGQSGVPWLRAWARQDTVLLQDPLTWEGGPASQLQLDELLLHELTHCVMYQQAAAGPGWQRKGIPVWFREGMASYTADQGYRRGSLPRLQESFRHGDPLAGRPRLDRADNEAVYGAGHHAFAFFVRRYGEQAVRRLLQAMDAGDDFDRAFVRAVGLERRGFEREFRHYVAMEGWRRQTVDVAGTGLEAP